MKLTIGDYVEVLLEDEIYRGRIEKNTASTCLVSVCLNNSKSEPNHMETFQVPHKCIKPLSFA